MSLFKHCDSVFLGGLLLALIISFLAAREPLHVVAMTLAAGSWLIFFLLSLGILFKGELNRERVWVRERKGVGEKKQEGREGGRERDAPFCACAFIGRPSPGLPSVHWQRWNCLLADGSFFLQQQQQQQPAEAPVKEPHLKHVDMQNAYSKHGTVWHHGCGVT